MGKCIVTLPAGIPPVWVLSCIFKAPTLLNAFSHFQLVYGFSAMWVLSWIFKAPVCVMIHLMSLQVTLLIVMFCHTHGRCGAILRVYIIIPFHPSVLNICHIFFENALVLALIPEIFERKQKILIMET